MEVSRLLAVLADIETDYKEGVSSLLADLIAQYTTARDNPTQDNTVAIKKASDSLVAYIDQGVFLQYPPSKAAVLNTIGGNQRVGPGLRQQLTVILSVPGQTTAGIVAGLTRLQKELEAFRKACSQVIAGLDALEVESHVIPDGQFEVGVLIPERLVDGKLGPLTKELEAWNKIVRGFQEVAGEEEREVTVIALASGSYEIYLPLTYMAASLLSRTIDKVLEWYLKILEIRKRRIELKELGAPVAEVTAVKAHEKELLETEVTKLVKELVKEAQPKADPGRRHELETHLTLSIRQIARFVDRGGGVEVTTTPPEEPEEPMPPAGEEPTPEQTAEYNRLKTQFERLQLEFNRASGILKEGAALHRLPERPEPILQLDDGQPSDEQAPTEKPPKKKS